MLRRHLSTVVYLALLIIAGALYGVLIGAIGLNLWAGVGLSLVFGIIISLLGDVITSALVRWDTERQAVKDFEKKENTR